MRGFWQQGLSKSGIVLLMHSAATVHAFGSGAPSAMKKLKDPPLGASRSACFDSGDGGSGDSTCSADFACSGTSSPLGLVVCSPLHASVNTKASDSRFMPARYPGSGE